MNTFYIENIGKGSVHMFTKPLIKYNFSSTLSWSLWGAVNFWVFICDINSSYVTQGSKTHRMSFWDFLFNHILHCIGLKILFTESEYLASNWSYTRLIRTFKKVKKSIKKFMIFRVIIILRNHYFIFLKLFRTIKFFILNQIKQTALKATSFEP